MEKFSFEYLNNYRNHGQNAEQSIRFTLTGEISKADNLRYDLGSDCLNYQIKSARATVCKGDDLDAYLDKDASTAYIYGTEDGKAYIMNRQEYTEFVQEFGMLTRDSTKNGGAVKIRLKHETDTLRKWLGDRA
jgi:hypothetical protein